MVQLVTRGQWGALAPNPEHLTPRSDPVVGITWHITDTDAGDPRGTFLAIQTNYMRNKGYGDIPYNGGVSLDGQVLAGRDAHWVGAHALSHENLANRLSWGVAVISHGELTKAAEDAMVAVSGLFQLTYHRPAVHVFHSTWNAPDGSATDCPGDQVREFVRATFPQHA